MLTCCHQSEHILENKNFHRLGFAYCELLQKRLIKKIDHIQRLIIPIDFIQQYPLNGSENNWQCVFFSFTYDVLIEALNDLSARD